MRTYVGVTDQSWFEFLAAHPAITEVNFWRPASGRRFAALQVGEPFFFKTHHPHHRLVGGGFFSGFAPLLVSEAWELFGEANGVAGLEEMRHRVGRYRRAAIAPGEDPTIGCVFIRDVRFFRPEEVLGAPADFASNIVQGKTYEYADRAAESAGLEVALNQILQASGLDPGMDAWYRPGPTRGDPILVRPRLGQQSFKAVVLDAYSRRCAVTGDRIRPVLEAAHIRPIASGGEHRIDNGLLLRSDVHTLFDRGYLGVDKRHELHVSPRLRTEFGNGEHFYALRGRAVALPAPRTSRPNREFLDWHMDTVFKAG